MRRSYHRGIGPDDFALVGRFFAGDDPHQAGLARAVAAEQADALARLDLEIDLVEQRGGAVLKRDLAKLKQWHGNPGAGDCTR